MTQRWHRGAAGYFFIVDGNIKGEYTELSNETDPNRRERGLNNWLMDQGW